MYIDGFISKMFVSFLFVSIILFLIYMKTKEVIPYKVTLIIKKVISVFLSFVLSLLIFLISFFKIKYRSTAINVSLLATFLFLYSVADLFYFQEKRNDYIMSLQSLIESRDNLGKLFDVVHLNGEYEKRKTNEKQNVSIIKTEIYGECLDLGLNNGTALKPKMEMSKELLEYYAKCLSLEHVSLPVFDETKNLSFIIQNYLFVGPLKPYIWIKSHYKKVKMILYVLMAIIFLICIFLVLCEKYDWFGFLEWEMEEI